MARASRVAMKTAKAVVTAGDQLAAVEVRLSAVEMRLTRIEKVLEQLVAAVSADKPAAEGQQASPKARTARKRGGA